MTSKDSLSINSIAGKCLAGILFVLATIVFLSSCSGKIVKLEKFDLPKQPDLLIYGANPSGIITAMTAIREGKTALIIEPTKRVGGIITGGLGFSDVCQTKYIGGYTKEYFQRIGARYGKRIQWRFEPHVGEEVFIEMVNENKIPIIFGQTIKSVKKSGTDITSVSLSSGKTIAAKIFVDASYEGDLLDLAGASFRVGREAKSEFNEARAGFTNRVRRNQFEVGISAYDEKGKLLPGVVKKDIPEAGSADGQVMAYNYRPCLTKRSDNKRSFPKPASYNPKDYEVLARYLNKYTKVKLGDILALHSTVRGKIDLNTKGPFSTDYLNEATNYVLANPAKRKKIIKKHKTYSQGLLYFLANSPRVPKRISDEINLYGLCEDEFEETDNWPHLLYVRVGRRLTGEHILTENDLIYTRRKDDSVAWGSCRIEVHHNQRIVDEEGYIYNEGIVAFRNPSYQIPYRSITPKREEVTNLLVPVAASATNVAYSSLRMEPVFMTLGQATGIAASMAIDSETSVQEIEIKKLQDTLRRQKQHL